MFLSWEPECWVEGSKAGADCRLGVAGWVNRIWVVGTTDCLARGLWDLQLRTESVQSPQDGPYRPVDAEDSPWYPVRGSEFLRDWVWRNLIWVWVELRLNTSVGVGLGMGHNSKLFWVNVSGANVILSKWCFGQALLMIVLAASAK